MTKKVVCIIPARGGSKGVPRKNIRPMAGLPLIHHTIGAALKCRSLSRVIVSTDDAEIAEIAKQAGAEVPFLRPSRYATDKASSISVIKHALRWLDTQENYRPDAVAVLPPTSPLRTVQQIEDTINLLWSSGRDSALTITPVKDHPYFIFSQNEFGELDELMKLSEKPLRRQELPNFFTHSQSVIVSLTRYLEECGDPAPLFNFNSSTGLEIDRESALDIDCLDDFMEAENILLQRALQSAKVA